MEDLITEQERKQWRGWAKRAKTLSERYNLLYDVPPENTEAPERFRKGCYRKAEAWHNVAEAIEEALLVPSF